MISSLRGNVVARMLDGVVLDVNGVGYRVQTTLRALPARRRRGARSRSTPTCTFARMHSALWVRRAGRARALRALPLGLRRGAEGRPRHPVGLDADGSPSARSRWRTDALRSNPGIGKKTAERVVLELKEKIRPIDALPGAPEHELVARDALVELGYSLPEAERALASTDPEAPPEERVRQALRAA